MDRPNAGSSEPILAVDVGNTHVVLGLYEGWTLTGAWRLETDPGRTADEYAVLVRALVPTRPRGVVLASVVPPLTATFLDLCRRLWGTEPLVVGPGIRTGVRLRVDNPREVGADRVVNAVAAYRRYGGPTLILDFGTATTLDVVSADGEYLGGAIAPGVRLAAEALSARAAKLPRVELAFPPRVIGRNTIHAMQSGLLWGYVGLVEGLVRRAREELDAPQARVIATGGLASLLAPHLPCLDRVHPDLTLEGLRWIWALNREGVDP